MPTQNRRGGQPPRTGSGLKAEARLLAWKIVCLNLKGALPPKTRGAARSAYQNATRKTFKSGRAIHLPGPNSAILVEEGAVDVFPDTDADEIPIKRLGPGCVFGDMPRLGMETFGTRMIAAEDSVIVFLDQDSFQTIIRKSPEVASRVIETLVRRVSKCEESEPAIKGLGMTESALIRLLPKLADQDRAIDGLSEDDLGRLLGLSRQAVSGALRRLKRRGLIEASRLHIKMLAPERSSEKQNHPGKEQTQWAAN